jgi:hypothetical protein
VRERDQEYDVEIQTHLQDQDRIRAETGEKVSVHEGLGRIERMAGARSTIGVARLLLPAGLLLAAIGYYGPWIGHGTSALTLSGVDMGEFVKFLPPALDGSLPIVRQAFYLPPLAIEAGVALLAGSRELKYSWPVRVLMLVLAVPVSLQILPPAWSPASLAAPEFRAQTAALGICWLLLAGFWVLGRLPTWVAGSLGATLALLASVLPTWQFLVTKPAIDAVYSRTPLAGWGFFLCLFGLLVVAVAHASLVFQTPIRGRKSWPRS